MLQVDRPGPRLPDPLAVAVAAVGPLGAALAEGCAAQRLDIQIHQPLGDELDHLPQQIGVRPLLSQLRQ